MVQRVGRLLTVLVLGTVLITVGAVGGELAPTETNDEREYEFAGCLGISVEVENSTTDALALTSENLTAHQASVRPTNETPPGPNETFRIESDLLMADDVCFSERVDDTGARLELDNVTNVNSTIFGPRIQTTYAEGTADEILIESPLTVDELIDEFM